MNKYLRQYLFPLLAALIWGISFLIQKDLGEIFGPFFINSFRSLLAVIALFIVALIFDGVKKIKKQPVEKVDKKKLIIGGICCGLSLSVAVNLQQIGLQGTSSGEGAFVTALYMIIVPIIGVFLKKKTGLNIWVAVVLALVGLFFICKPNDNSFNFNISYLYLILCAIAFAVQIVFVDYFVQYVDGVKLSCVQFLVVAISSGIVSLIFEKNDLSQLNFENFISLFYMGVLSGAGGYTLQILAQKGTDPTCVSLLLCLESFFALVAEIIVGIVLNNPVILPWVKYLGCGLMLLAVFLTVINPFELLKKKKQ